MSKISVIIRLQICDYLCLNHYTNNSDILKEIVWIVVTWFEKGGKIKRG
jgi:hypothetical protein